jgi:hypothetical protein
MESTILSLTVKSFSSLIDLTHLSLSQNPHCKFHTHSKVFFCKIKPTPPPAVSQPDAQTVLWAIHGTHQQICTAQSVPLRHQAPQP